MFLFSINYPFAKTIDSSYTTFIYFMVDISVANVLENVKMEKENKSNKSPDSLDTLGENH